MIICKTCKEEKPHESYGMCLNCYRCYQYANNPKIKIRMREACARFRENNRERYNKRAREYYHNKTKLKNMEKK